MRRRPSGWPHSGRGHRRVARVPRRISITPVGSRVRSGYEQRPPRATPTPAGTSRTRRRTKSSRWAPNLRPPSRRAAEASDRLARRAPRRSGGEPEARTDADRPRLDVRRQRRAAERERDCQRDDHAGSRRRLRASTNASAPSAAATATPTTIQIQADEPPPADDDDRLAAALRAGQVADEPRCGPNEAVGALLDLGVENRGIRNQLPPLGEGRPLGHDHEQLPAVQELELGAEEARVVEGVAEQRRHTAEVALRRDHGDLDRLPVRSCVPDRRHAARRRRPGRRARTGETRRPCRACRWPDRRPPELQSRALRPAPPPARSGTRGEPPGENTALPLDQMLHLE